MNDPDEIQAVTFDVGGTLIQPWPSVGHIYSEVAGRHGARVAAEELNRRFRASWRKLKEFNHGRDEWAALVDETFHGLTQTLPSETFFPELFERFAEAGAWKVFEDALPALDELAAMGTKLGIISNWDERLRPLLDKLRLSKYFETITVSCEVGFSKPSPVIFEHTAKKLGLPPERILHVGDDRENDFEGAKGAGFQAMLLERGNGKGTDGILRTLEGLHRVVGR